MGRISRASRVGAGAPPGRNQPSAPAALKRRYDPANVFHLNQNIRP